MSDVGPLTAKFHPMFYTRVESFGRFIISSTAPASSPTTRRSRKASAGERPDDLIKLDCPRHDIQKTQEHNVWKFSALENQFVSQQCRWAVG